VITTSLLTTERWFQICTDKSCFNLHILTDNWKMTPTLHWQIMLRSQHRYHAYCQLTYDSKFYLTSYVLIWAALLTTDRWFQSLTDKSCFDLNIHTDSWQIIPNFNRQTMFWLQCPYWQLNDDSKFYQTGHVSISTSILGKFIYIVSRDELSDTNLYYDSKFKPTNHVLISVFILTTDKWFQILTDKSCFDLNIRTDNWQMIPIEILSDHSYFICYILTGTWLMAGKSLTG